MLNSVLETRRRDNNGIYHLLLTIPEEEYFNVYEDIDDNHAKDIIKLYLEYHQDDGRPTNISIDYDKNSHVVKLNTQLKYEDNDHTESSY